MKAYYILTDPTANDERNYIAPDGSNTSDVYSADRFETKKEAETAKRELDPEDKWAMVTEYDFDEQYL